MATEQWSNEFLNAMRQVGDPLGDALVEETFTTQGMEGLKRLNKFLQNTNDWPPPDDLAPGVRKFFNAAVHYPPWVDMKQILQADLLFFHHPLQTLLVTFLRSFAQVFANANAARVFYQADIFNPNTLERFIIEAAQLIFDVVLPGSLRVKPEKGKGVIAVQKLRLHHSLIRFYLLKSPSVEPWNSAAWGVPINQEDMTFGVLAFALWNLSGFEKLRLYLTAEEQEATLMLWKVIGFLLGQREDLQPANLAEAERLFALICERQIRPSDQGTSLVRQLLNVIKGFLPWILRGLPVVVMRFLMDPFFVVLLRVPRAWSLAALLIKLLRPAAHEITPALAHRLVLGLQAKRKDRDGNPLAFRVPEPVAQRLFAPAITSDEARQEPPASGRTRPAWDGGKVG